jgi:uncharacterized repeat protein (TIGR03803 family)
MFLAAGSAHAATETIIYSFEGGKNGANPATSLIYADGAFYGVAGAENAGHGVVFSVTPQGRGRIIHRFKGGADGASPNGLLAAIGTSIYGTTSEGGDYIGNCVSGGCGTIFAIAKGGSYRVLHAFGFTDGQFPTDLLAVGRTLYGTTSAGGSADRGVVFSLTPKGNEATVYSFEANGPSSPVAGLIRFRGTGYGTTYGGGASGNGTVYAITPGGSETEIYSFASGGNGGDVDGAAPRGRLTEWGGVLYGTTSAGGTYGAGTIFSVTPSGAEKLLHSFQGGADGFGPWSTLVKLGSKLYGTTVYGGTQNSGVIFSITPEGTEKIVYSFGTNAASPGNNLVNVGGTLYGTATYGGAHGYGAVFSLQP